jgi:hypothetical protein
MRSENRVEMTDTAANAPGVVVTSDQTRRPVFRALMS